MRVYTGGTFDLFHPGHVNLLRRCRLLAGKDGVVVVSLNTDEFIEAYKGRRPVMTYEARKYILESCKYVDVVVENTGGADSKPAIIAQRPDMIVIGSDWHDRDYLAQMDLTWEWLSDRNIALVYVSATKGISTTAIREKLG